MSPPGEKFSLALLSDGDRSLLGSLPTAFSRASLWRPSWVGAWTFWVLAIALLATFGLAVVAVISAAGDDDAPVPRDGPAELGRAASTTAQRPARIVRSPSRRATCASQPELLRGPG